MPDKNIILKTLSEHSSQLRNFGVTQIGLFGSFVRGQATDESDIDLLVDISTEKKTFRNFMSLNYYLEELFHLKVELVTVQSLSPYIGPYILNSVEYAPLTD